MYKLLLPVLLCIGIVSLLGTHQSVWNPGNRVSFLNIGQGDATLIQTTSGVRILVDCGPPGGPILDRLQDQLGFVSRRIDMLVITHGDSDHYGGCQDVLDYYQIGTTMINGVNDPENEAYTTFLEGIYAETRVIPGIAGTSITHQDLEITVLAPEPGVWGQDSKDDNEYSIVLHLNTPTKDFLLTGDIPILVESQLVASGYLLDVDVLKAGHHGSNTSTGSALLDATSPEEVIISAGADNSFGHPHPEVITRLENKNITIRETKNHSSIDFSF